MNDSPSTTFEVGGKSLTVPNAHVLDARDAVEASVRRTADSAYLGNPVVIRVHVRKIGQRVQADVTIGRSNGSTDSSVVGLDMPELVELAKKLRAAALRARGKGGIA
jgi:hypothetical protein